MSIATADLVLTVRPNLLDPLAAVAVIPDGVTIDEHSVITDPAGHTFAYARARDFERLANTAPFSRRWFFPLGQEVHILPPDTAKLHLTL